MSLLNVPAAHGEHVPPSCPVYPASHLQDTLEILPVLEFEAAGHDWQLVDPRPVSYVPTPQGEHAAEPVASLNSPGAHAMHGPTEGPE